MERSSKNSPCICSSLEIKSKLIFKPGRNELLYLRKKTDNADASENQERNVARH